MSVADTVTDYMHKTFALLQQSIILKNLVPGSPGATILSVNFAGIPPGRTKTRQND